jgi:hypothetical protein
MIAQSLRGVCNLVIPCEVMRLNCLPPIAIPAKEEELMDTYGDPRSHLFRFKQQLSPRNAAHPADKNVAFAFPRHCISSMKFSNYSTSAIGEL